MSHREMVPLGDPATAYVLLHLDDYEMEEGSLLVDHRDWSTEDYAALGKIVAGEILRVAAQCGRRLAVIDTFETRDTFEAGAVGDIEYETEILPPLGGIRMTPEVWRPVAADRAAVAAVAHTFGPGERVILAGFARNDCVRRLAAAFERRGVDLILHDLAIVPLTDAAVGAAYRIFAGG